jgi:Histidine kinase-like ATPase domain
MFRKTAEDVFPSPLPPPAGPSAFPRRRDHAARAATVPHLSLLQRRTGIRWLLLAAEMAGLASGNQPDPAAAGWSHVARIATRALGADVGSVHIARSFTSATLRRWDLPERGQDIVVVVSELVTNALRHALPGAGDTRLRRPVPLGLLQLGPCVLCAVADPSRTVPAPRVPSSLGETGRGLHIICALSDQWGCTAPSDAGKAVWATFYRRTAAPA